MSDNQRYVNEFRGYAAYGPDGDLLNLEEAIDAVVAAVRKDEECKTILRSSALGLKQTHAVFQEGKRAAARDIRAHEASRIVADKLGAPMSDVEDALALLADRITEGEQ